jgi:carboxylate-amine ligase
MASFEDARLSRSPRYRQVSDSLQGLLRSPPAALHVHVGMPDPETAIRAANGLRRHLPLILSLAANSPFWNGRDSGLASARTAVLRSYPRYGVPRWFRDWEDFCACARELTVAAAVPDYTYFWWDVRPHPQLGTVEIRAADAQFSVARTVALAALMHALARMAAESPPPPYQSRETIEAACYQASRYGLDARLPDDDGELVPARELARRVVERSLPYAVELAADAALGGVEEILLDGNGAEVQRRVQRRRGLEGLLAWLVARTGAVD